MQSVPEMHEYLTARLFQQYGLLYNLQTVLKERQRIAKVGSNGTHLGPFSARVPLYFPTWAQSGHFKNLQKRRQPQPQHIQQNKLSISSFPICLYFLECVHRVLSCEVKEVIGFVQNQRIAKISNV